MSDQKPQFHPRSPLHTLALAQRDNTLALHKLIDEALNGFFAEVWHPWDEHGDSVTLRLTRNSKHVRYGVEEIESIRDALGCHRVTVSDSGHLFAYWYTEEGYKESFDENGRYLW